VDLYGDPDTGLELVAAEEQLAWVLRLEDESPFTKPA